MATSGPAHRTQAENTRQSLNKNSSDMKMANVGEIR